MGDAHGFGVIVADASDGFLINRFRSEPLCWGKVGVVPTAIDEAGVGVETNPTFGVTPTGVPPNSGVETGAAESSTSIGVLVEMEKS